MHRVFDLTVVQLGSRPPGAGPEIRCLESVEREHVPLLFNISKRNHNWLQRATDGWRIRRCDNGARGKKGKSTERLDVM